MQNRVNTNNRGEITEVMLVTKPNSRLVYTIAEVNQILGLSDNSVRKAIDAGTMSQKSDTPNTKGE